MLSSLLAMLVLCILGARGNRNNDADYCRQPKEIVFLLDSSASVHEPDFQKLLNFTQTMIDSLDLETNSTRVTVILFGSSAQIKVNFDGYESKEDLKEQVGNILRRYETTTNTHLGLKMAREKVFSLAEGITQIIICVTDGQPTRKSEVVKEVAMLKERNVHIFAIGVGHKINEEGLKDLATEDSEAFVHSVDIFDKLNGLVDELSWHLCAVDEGPNACSNDMTELVIILDSSTSIQEERFTLTKNFSRELINALNMGPQLTQVALIVYGSSIAQTTDLNPNKEEVLQALDGLTFRHRGNTHTELALRAAERKIQNGRQDASRRIVVLFNDGFYQHKTATEEKATTMRNGGTYIFGIGLVRNDVEKAMVVRLTSQGHTASDHQFYYDITNTTAPGLIAAEIGLLRCQAIAP